MASITTRTAISIGVVISLAGAAMSYGVLYQQVQDVRGQQQEMKIDVKSLASKLDAFIVKVLASKNA